MTVLDVIDDGSIYSPSTVKDDSQVLESSKILHGTFACSKFDTDMINISVEEFATNSRWFITAGKTEGGSKSKVAEKKQESTKSTGVKDEFEEVKKRLKAKKEKSSPSPQVAKASPSRFGPVRDPERVFTVKTQCDLTILFVTKPTDFMEPGYTRPVTKKLLENKALKAAMKVDILADRRSFDDPFALWTKITQSKREPTKEYTLYWQLYIRVAGEDEENNEEYRKKWGNTMTDLMNRAGKKFEYPTAYRYAGDLGSCVLGEYCTVPYVFKYIEDEYCGKLNWTKLDIANDNDVLELHFGKDQEYIQRVKEWYLRHIGIPLNAPNNNGNENNANDNQPEEGDDDDLLQYAQQMM
jgi:hypothetical protein